MNWIKTVCLTLALVCGSLTGQAQVKRVLPKTFKKIELGMSMADFAQVRKRLNTEDLSRDKFRYRWTENIKKGKGIASAVYYFDDSEDKSLYEVIIYYNDLRVRDAWLAKNFGAPNHKNNTEWRFASTLGTQIHAWRYEDRLVVVAALRGTEWEED